MHVLICETRINACSTTDTSKRHDPDLQGAHPESLVALVVNTTAQVHDVINVILMLTQTQLHRDVKKEWTVSLAQS
jgi:hypothetical protein